MGQQVKDVVQQNCQEGEDVLVCDIKGETEVLEKPDDQVMDVPATESNLETFVENQSL